MTHLNLSHCFQDPSLAELALTHRSAGRPNNERMEFLGDALLNMLVAEMLFQAHPHASEGEMSRLRAQLVSGKALAVIGRELELGNSLKLGPGEMKSGGFRRGSILADAVEALLAAVYLDAGFEACRDVVRNLFQARVNATPKSRKDAKTELQEWLQGHAMALPEYVLVDSFGEDHAKTFDILCRVAQPQPWEVSARGSSRREAEQKAAREVLEHLRGGDAA